MGAPADTTVSIRVVSDSRTEAELVRGLLEDDFSNLTICVDMATAVTYMEPDQPGVLVLAFKELTRAEKFYGELVRLNPPQDRAQQRVIVLCTNSDVKAAYDLCRSGVFDDYVLFWPVTQDTKRLPLAVHRSAREVLGGREAGAVAAPDTGITPPKEVRTAENTNASSGPRLTVLVVDDDDFQRMLSGKVLQASGYHAEFAENGAVALRTLMLARDYPDVILLDVQMPDMDGLQVLAQLKGAPQLATIPVIMVSGNNERDVIVRALTLGAVDYIVKPFNSQALATKLVRALQKPGTSSSGS